MKNRFDLTFDGKWMTFKTHGHGGMQRAIEAHADACGAVPPAA